MRFLETNTADVIISSEAAIYGFGGDRRQDLLKFLREMKSRRPTTFVFALRRVDEYCESVYNQEIRTADLKLTPEEYVKYATDRVPVWFETLQLIAKTLVLARHILSSSNVRSPSLNACSMLLG